MITISGWSSIRRRFWVYEILQLALTYSTQLVLTIIASLGINYLFLFYLILLFVYWMFVVAFVNDSWRKVTGRASVGVFIVTLINIPLGYYLTGRKARKQLSLAPLSGIERIALLFAAIASLGLTAIVSLAFASNFLMCSTRCSGNYAAVKSNLSTIQTQAELYYDENNRSYGPPLIRGTECTGGMFDDPTIGGAIKSAENAGASPVLCGISADGQFYSVSAHTKYGNWCVNGENVSTSTIPC